MVLCEKGDEGRWDEAASSNFPGWYQTEDDLGVVVYWRDGIAGRDGPVEVLFGGRRWPAHTAAGLCFVAFWDQLDPDNHIDPPWPVIAQDD